ncbi:hypothetical protein DOTSEDRAFT_180526 [Dothistroma septosporum NZE10]|uniref:FAD-binding domain-containing protein n=1 Tax=Dothistroma septosporum (strain NZE10 / CBS 128990) TaxID=675120 RepID=M2WI53_DOTSN|nr:hypothetical protein DOTSEDRAFT_180526 [Dothistroma septosporum NZE10]
MESTQIVIIGAGPSGLALSCLLGLQKIQSIVLESNRDIVTDPRAIALSGDSTRILSLLGIDQHALDSFAQSIDHLKFHSNTIWDKPYLTLRQDEDWLGQVTPGAAGILQPKLEENLRHLVASSEYSELRTGCSFVAQMSVDSKLRIHYTTHDAKDVYLMCDYLVGADGKRGAVRKHALEPLGIRQLVGVHKYEARWVAANLQIHLPTPESHPSFPLWKLGYRPREVWDIFWPAGFHFCNHATKSVATGRFGPRDERFWRFEYELPSEAEPEDLLDDLKVQVLPHITLPSKAFPANRRPDTDNVTFPWDCVEVLRCISAVFAHKVVNRWWHERVILIGDAAHVFPPFAAQGIANGLRDALALAWRLNVMCKSGEGTSSSAGFHPSYLLQNFSKERRAGVDASSKTTMNNGHLLSNKSWLLAQAMGFVSGLLDNYFSWIKDYLIKTLQSDAHGYQGLEGGFFLADGSGGGKMAQVWTIATENQQICLSDGLFLHHDAPLTLLVLSRQHQPVTTAEITDLISSFETSHDIAGRPQTISSKIVVMEDCEKQAEKYGREQHHQFNRLRSYRACTNQELKAAKIQIPNGYRASSFWSRFAPSSRYVLVRNDFIIFSQAGTHEELRRQLVLAEKMLTGGRSA